MVVITVPTQSGEGTAVAPPPVSPLVGNWGDQPWSRGNSEIVLTGTPLEAIMELNPDALQQQNEELGDGEHSDHSAAMTAEAPHDEDSPSAEEHEDGEEEQYANGAEEEGEPVPPEEASHETEYWPEEDDVNRPPPHSVDHHQSAPYDYPPTHYDSGAMESYPTAPCSCDECMQQQGSYDTYTHSSGVYSHSPYQSSNYTGYYDSATTQCTCAECVPPAHRQRHHQYAPAHHHHQQQQQQRIVQSKRVFRYNLPPPPPITADNILQNLPALQHIMYKWYHRVQGIELGPVPPCPPPASDYFDPGYSFNQWMAMCSEWYHTHFFTGRPRRAAPTPTTRPMPTYATTRWNTTTFPH